MEIYLSWILDLEQTCSTLFWGVSLQTDHCTIPVKFGMFNIRSTASHLDLAQKWANWQEDVKKSVVRIMKTYPYWKLDPRSSYRDFHQNAFSSPFRGKEFWARLLPNQFEAFTARCGLTRVAVSMSKPETMQLIILKARKGQKHLDAVWDTAEVRPLGLDAIWAYPVTPICFLLPNKDGNLDEIQIASAKMDRRYGVAYNRDTKEYWIVLFT